MKITGIVCEYNPFHNGHARQLVAAKEMGSVICLMSGNYVQRGEPAICDRLTRAKAAVSCGADLVLELPVTCALRSAEGFADGSVALFERLGCVDRLSFGSETGEIEPLMDMAELLLQENFKETLKDALTQGLSFPAARQKAVERLGRDSSVLECPNDILGVEYCKALLRQNSSIQPVTMKREGSYHESNAPQAPSASVLRAGEDWQDYMPQTAWELQSAASRHTLIAGQRAVLARVRSMTEAEFEALPFGSEGLWRRLMNACRQENTIEDILTAAKSKRYTRSRLQRMLLCAFLGLSEMQMAQSAPYVRILAANAQGGKLLRRIRENGALCLLHPGERPPESEYASLERRCQALYGLFCQGETEKPERNEKVTYIRA